VFEKLPRLSVQRPVLATMLVAVFVVLGVFSLGRLNTALFPEVEFPVVTVSTVYPGASPEEIETQVTDPIEEAIATLANLDELRSFSRQDVSIVVVQFDLGVDADQAAIDVRDRIEAIRGELPAQAEPPVVQRFDLNALPIMDLALSGPQGTDVLYELADRDLRQRLSRVDGVASIDVVGGREREVEVLVHPERLAAHGVTLGEIVQLIRAENVSVPSGRVTEPRVDVPVRVVGEYRSAREIEDLRLARPEGRPVRLGEIATVREGFADARQVARYDGQPAVGIAVQRRTDANTVTTAEGVLRELEAIRATLPPGASIAVVRDSSEFIRASVRDVLFNLFVGIVLTTAVLFLFLHSWRGTVIAAAAMPATVVSTFLLVDAAGFTLNVMTLMALSITVGILVTNTIVVLESIYRRLDAAQDPRAAAEGGTSEVAVAVLASTLTNLVVFTPIAFMAGIIGQFFLAFGLTVVFATLFSIFISFTLAPMLASRLLRTGETALEERESRLSPVWRRWDAGYASLERRYARVLAWALATRRNGWVVIGGILAASMATLVLAGRFVGGEFMPQQNERAMRVTLELPPDTPLERTSAVAARAEEMMRGIDDVESMLTTIGGGVGLAGIGGAVHRAEILVTLREEARPSEAVIRDVRPLLADLPDASVSVVPTDPGEVGPGGQAPIQLLVSGPDYETLGALAARVTEELLRVPQLSEVNNTLEEPRTELVFRPDRAALADYGLTVGAVGETVRAAIQGAEAGIFRGEVGRERDIRVRLAEAARERVAQVGEVQIRTPAGPVPLRALGALVAERAPTSIERYDRIRTVQIDAQIGVGTLTEAVAAIQERMAAAPLPPGYEWRVTGEFEMFSDAVASILVALVLAVTLTYIVLAMILESFVHPFTIMLTLPLGAVGAYLALFLWGASMNIFSMMAIVMLVGIVVNNAILILDRTGQLRRDGRGPAAALLEAGPARLRPIIMSNVAIAVALLPQVIARGEGAAFRVPMAVVTIGGVLVAAIFTLFLIPVIYLKIDRLSLASRRAPASSGSGSVVREAR
jgi:hydrophobic/amphiphilic exporter-1 (mainly G- bacteria), HAE1 family